MNINDTLAQRGRRYGLFTDHAEVTQMLKAVITTALNKRNKTLAPDQQEALDMICHKIGRIINGDPNYDDSWVDIAGYAKLVADRLRGEGEDEGRRDSKEVSVNTTISGVQPAPGSLTGWQSRDI
jgi:hypothetical protein